MAIPSIINNFKNATYWRRQAKPLLDDAANQPRYNASQYTKNQYGLAQQLFGGRMAGATAKEQNIMAGQANQIANVNRTASDGNQALALAAGLQGNTNQELANLQQLELINQGNTVNNLNTQAAAMTQEHQNVHQDKVRVHDDAVRRRDAYMSAYQQNKTEGIKGIEQLVRTFVSMMAGGMGGMGGGMGGGGGAASGAGGFNMSSLMGMFGGGQK